MDMVEINPSLEIEKGPREDYFGDEFQVTIKLNKIVNILYKRNLNSCFSFRNYPVRARKRYIMIK